MSEKTDELYDAYGFPKKEMEAEASIYEDEKISERSLELVEQSKKNYEAAASARDKGLNMAKE